MLFILLIIGIMLQKIIDFVVPPTMKINRFCLGFIETAENSKLQNFIVNSEALDFVKNIQKSSNYSDIVQKKCSEFMDITHYNADAVEIYGQLKTHLNIGFFNIENETLNETLNETFSKSFMDIYKDNLYAAEKNMRKITFQSFGSSKENIRDNNFRFYMDVFDIENTNHHFKNIHAISNFIQIIGVHGFKKQNVKTYIEVITLTKSQKIQINICEIDYYNEVMKTITSRGILRNSPAKL